ncbi:MAG: HAMP domain-containing histidine kinase [Firmicutes bacterium]|nr:HAMP domain-containing histidine kinase [Bacillota bacterium]
MMNTDLINKKPLWTRLTLYFLGVAAVTLLIFQLVFNYSLERHFITYVAEREEALNRQIVAAVLDYYEENGSWSGFQMPLFHIALSTNTRLVLADESGRYIVDSGQGRRRHSMMTGVGEIDLEEAAAYHYQLNSGQAEVGKLIIVHRTVERGTAWQEQDFVFKRTITRSLLMTGILAVSVALILGVIFSRRLSKPLEEVADAALVIARGDYSHKLPTYENRELAELSASFNQMTGQLQELEMLRKRSVADLAHELRTPLTTLRSYVEAVRDGVLPADEQHLNILMEEIMHLNRVATDLDELARAERTDSNGREREKIELNRFLSDKAASFKPLFQAKTIALNLELPDERLHVFQDPAVLGKIIGNLVDNAYRYTDAGGVVTLGLHNVPVFNPVAVAPFGPAATLSGPGESPDPKKLLMITISDSGIGIDPDQLPYIFERFFRVDPARERGNKGGSGIGLALVRELVRSAGGLIQVASSPGTGTTFYLYLPKA